MQLRFVISAEKAYHVQLSVAEFAMQVALETSNVPTRHMAIQAERA